MRLTQYKPLEKTEIERRYVRAVCKLATVEAVKKAVAELEARAKKITKRETDKITEQIKDLCSEYGQVKVSFGANRYSSNNELSVNLDPNPETQKRTGHWSSIDLFEITYPAPNVWRKDVIEWKPLYDWSLSVEGLQDFVDYKYPRILQDFKKIQSILDKRDKAIEAAIKAADAAIPDHIHAAISSYS